jgi:hypothetical protein
LKAPKYQKNKHQRYDVWQGVKIVKLGRKELLRGN